MTQDTFITLLSGIIASPIVVILYNNIKSIYANSRLIIDVNWLPCAITKEFLGKINDNNTNERLETDDQRSRLFSSIHLEINNTGVHRINNLEILISDVVTAAYSATGLYSGDLIDVKVDRDKMIIEALEPKAKAHLLVFTHN